MSNSDTWIPKMGDIPAAIGLLSRLPMRVDMHKAQARGAHPSWAYGLAGGLLGALAALAAWAGLMLGLPSLAIGLIVVGTTAWLTGAMHYDGLADSLDGLWGGWSPQQRLDIMKDSHIGVYGVVGLICVLGLQAALYGQLAAQNLWAILGVMALSRAIMVPLMTALPNARSKGLSASVGRPTLQTAILAVALGGAIAALSGAWPALIGAPLGALAVAIIAKRKIGGQTGDILGASQQCAETCALICLIAFL